MLRIGRVRERGSAPLRTGRARVYEGVLESFFATAWSGIRNPDRRHPLERSGCFCGWSPPVQRRVHQGLCRCRSAVWRIIANTGVHGVLGRGKRLAVIVSEGLSRHVRAVSGAAKPIMPGLYHLAPLEYVGADEGPAIVPAVTVQGRSVGPYTAFMWNLG